MYRKFVLIQREVLHVNYVQDDNSYSWLKFEVNLFILRPRNIFYGAIWGYKMDSAYEAIELDIFISERWSHGDKSTKKS